MAAVRAVLPRAARVETAPKDSGADVAINGALIEVKWGGEGWLRQVRDLIASSRDLPLIVVARRMSPGARELLGSAGIGWIDETGAAEIAIGSLIVSRTGQPKETERKGPRWTRATLAVAEALLCQTRPTVAATKEATGLSAGSCITALKSLTQLGLLNAEASRGPVSSRRIVDRDRLLDAYSSAVADTKPSAHLTVGVTWKDIITGLIEIGQIFDKAGASWAVTGAAASLVLAPYLTNVNAADVFVDAKTASELEAMARDTGLRPIEGGRLRLLPFPSAAVPRLAERIRDLRVAPWPRVYADLRTTGVRGEEAAEHLREVIGGR